MKKSLVTLAAAALMVSFGASAAETTVKQTTTWTDAYGNEFREQYKTKHYNAVTDPKIEVRVGGEVPSSVTMYALPDTVKVQDPDKYNYVIINENPVVVERSTRRIIHKW